MKSFAYKIDGIMCVRIGAEVSHELRDHVEYNTDKSLEEDHFEHIVQFLKDEVLPESHI